MSTNTKNNNVMSETDYEPTVFEMVATENGYESQPVNRSLSKTGFGRRDFLKGLGVMVVGVSLSGGITTAQAAAAGETAALADPPNTQVDSYIVIGADGLVTFHHSRSDHGQGVVTGFMQMVAEELDVSFANMRAVIGDTALVPNDGGFGGSSGIRNSGPKLARAAAAARAKLLQLAAARFSVTIDKLTVNDGVISVIGDPTKSVTYAQLIVGKRFDVTIPDASAITLKPASQYKIVGQPIQRIDIPTKLTGEFEFVADVRVPGMLYGRTIRPRGQAYREFFQLISVDEKSVAGVKGLVKVVTVTDRTNGNGNFVGVVCEREEQAIRAAEILARNIVWGTPPQIPQDLYQHLLTVGRGNPSSTQGGDVNAALASSAAKVLTATYKFPFQLHAPFGSYTSVADVKVDSKGNVISATCWTGSQGAYGTRTTVGNALGIPPEQHADKVRAIWKSPAGTYGPNAVSLCDVDAALLSRAVGRPVKLQWFREDSHGYDTSGPLHLMYFTGGLNSAGKIVAHIFDMWGSGIEGSSGGQRYDYGNAPANFMRISGSPTGGTFFTTSPLRAPNGPATCFGSEGFLDELAHAAKADPIQFRLAHLLDQSVEARYRLRATLIAAAEKFKWETRPSPNPANAGILTGKVRGRGIAHGGFAGTYVSTIIEVEVDLSTGAVNPLRAVVAHDCGLVVNPESVRQQAEGCTAQSISRALWEEVKHDGYRVSTVDWVGYRVTKMTEVPRTEVVLVHDKRTDVIQGGVGEPAVVPVAAAIGNAIFDAIGVRIRQVPLTPERVLAALKAR